MSEGDSAVGLVLISTAPATEREVLESLKKIPEVVDLMPLFGEYDFYAKVVAENFGLLGKIIVDKIRAIDGVTDSKTLTGTTFD